MKKIGIDLGGSHVSIGVVDENGKIIKQYEKDFTVKEKQNIMEVAENYITKNINLLKEELDIKSVGLAMPGTIKDGIVVKSVNLGIEDYNLGEKLLKSTGIEFKIKNDAKCAALGEYEYEIKDSTKKILFLTLGTGIGGAFIYDGKLLEGGSFEGYEFGHMTIKENGILCRCGKKGCFEKYGSILCFKEKIQNRLNLSADISGPDLRKEIAKHEEKVKDIQEEYIKDLNLGLSNLINIFEPDIIIIGGGFARYDYMLLDKLKNSLLTSGLLFNKRDNLDLRVAKLGNDAGVVGASCL